MIPVPPILSDRTGMVTARWVRLRRRLTRTLTATRKGVDEARGGAATGSWPGQEVFPPSGLSVGTMVARETFFVA
eukprot:2107553-Rhodomonas_salina.2